MLVLTRKSGERIVIGDRITVTIVKCHNGRVSIGIEAPDEVNVVREEILSAFRSLAGIARETGLKPRPKG